MALMKARLEDLERIIEAERVINAGGTISLDFIPGQGTIIRVNNALEMRQRLRPLRGWETAIAHGPWTAKGVVDLAHEGRAKLRFEEVRVLPPLSN